MELEQPAEQDSATPEAETSEALDLDEGLLDEQQPEDEAEEELEGVKLKGKKDLIEKIKAERLMQADYTRKTQAVAEERKAVEEARKAVAQHAQLTQQFTKELGSLAAVDEQLEQFNQVNWAQLIDQDPATAQKLDLQRRALQDKRSQLSASITQRQQQALHMQQQEVARQVQEGQAVLQREIKGWSPDLASKLVQFGVERGFQAHDLQTVTNPAIVKLLHDAYTLDQLRKNASKRQPVAQDKPVPTVTTQKAVAARDPDKMPTDEWLKWRNAQLKRK